MAFYDLIVRMQGWSEESRRKYASGPRPTTARGRELPDAGRAISGAEMMTLQVVRAVLEGHENPVAYQAGVAHG
jgi:hypothetical protein